MEEDSPAAMAGLAQGDVIVGFDGREVTEMRDLPRMVADMAAGETVSADIWRDGGSMALEVAIGILGEDEDDAEDEEGAAEEADESEFSLGLTIAPMTAEARVYYEVGGGDRRRDRRRGRVRQHRRREGGLGSGTV